jgi:transcriptional regulator with XRE-family HTH domain
MELGNKIKQARLDAGLSQRQLCGDTITRNMLSQIENGSARPSMDTLQFLASRLGKSVSFFLEENTIQSPNPAVMDQARQAYSQRKYDQVLQILQNFQEPDPLFEHEQRYLLALSALAQAEVRIASADSAGAVGLLENIHRGSIYYRPDMEQKRRILLRQCYQQLETQAQQQEDYKQAYLYACKLRELA